MGKNYFINTESHEKIKEQQKNESFEMKMNEARKIIGMKFNHLTITDVLPPNKSIGRSFLVKCKCDCGNEIIKQKHIVLKSYQKTCGSDCIYTHKNKKGDGAWTKDKFILEAEKKFSNKYDFSSAIYINRYTPIKVECKKHGIFEIKPCNLLRGGMCPKCREESKLIYGVGISDFVGEEPHRGNKVWEIWAHMIQRCYSDSLKKKLVSYNNVTVCKDWHRYSTFRKWYIENYIDGCDIDKDLLQHGLDNKIYSPETVLFLPHEINCKLITNKRSRGNYPIGVHKIGNRFYAYMNKENNELKLLGSSNTIHGAFLIYKKAKEEHLKKLADKYFAKGMITEKAKNALYNYQVFEED